MTNEMMDNVKHGWRTTSPAPAFLIGALLLALIVFRDVLVSGHFLFSTDDNIGALALLKRQLPHAFLGRWDDSLLLGVANAVPLSWTPLLSWLLPLSIFMNWIHAIDLILGSFFLALFLRERGLASAAAALAALTAYWLGSTFTLTYAGHIGKFGVVLFVGLYLWLIERAVRTRSPAYAALAGGAMGMMFLEQVDVALFFALILGPYALFAIARERGTAWREYVRILGPLLVLAALLAFRPAWSAYTLFVASPSDAAAETMTESPEAKWEFTTQWSWPPEESIDFIAPGFMGWRSGEPEGPYTGRMGRSAGWEQTGQGFRNFKLESQYLGAIPLLFALWGAVAARRRHRAGDGLGMDMIFWSSVTVITLLLSFGKYFPLYALFYQLPMVSSIRNPNKFLQVFQLALGVLAAFGMHDWMRTALDRKAMPKNLMYVGFTLAAFLILWGLGSWVSWDAMVLGFQKKGWGTLADTIALNRVWALLHGGLMTLMAVVSWRLYATRERWRPFIPWALIALVVFDVLFLARHYVKTMPREAVAENELIQIFKADPADARVALVSQDGFYNQWLTFLFPYHDVQAINITQMPRMPEEYRAYLNAVGGNPLRFWQLGAVGYLAGPAQIWQQISNDPVLRDQYELIFAYNVEPIEGGVRVHAATPQQPGQHVVIHAKTSAPRYALISGWRVVPDKEALSMLSSPGFKPFTQVLVAPDAAEPLGDAPPGEIIGSIQRIQYRAGLFHLRVSVDEPAILRVSEKYDAHWKATVNGIEVPVRRVDYIAMGIFVSPGMHDVVLRYAPPNGSLFVQWAGMLLMIVAGVRVLLKRRANKP